VDFRNQPSFDCPPHILKLQTQTDLRARRNRNLMLRRHPQEGESEWDEVERELGGAGKQAEESKPSRGVQQVLRRYFSPVFVEALVLNFLAEWGDRSQVPPVHIWGQQYLLGRGRSVRWLGGAGGVMCSWTCMSTIRVEVCSCETIATVLKLSKRAVRLINPSFGRGVSMTPPYFTCNIPAEGTCAHLATCAS